MDLNSPLAEVLLPFYEEFVEENCPRQSTLTKDVITLMLLGIYEDKEVTTILIQSGHEEAISKRKPCWLRKLQSKHKHTVEKLATKMREQNNGY